MADAGFVRNDLQIWLHPDGRAIGESVAVALTDQVFFQYIGIEPPEAVVEAADNSFEISIN
jgi:hypothetical protein